MRQVVYPQAGPPEIMRIEDAPDLTAGAGEAIICVHRAGINFADLMMRLGLYDAAPDFPFTPGYEVAGVITELGEGAEGFDIGQRVGAFTEFGGYSEQVQVRSEQMLPLDHEVSFDIAAAMPVTYITGFHMLVHLGNIQPRDTVLVHHAAGGVGTAAAQIARAYGAGKIFGVASSPKKEFVEAHGMRFIDREREDFVEVVKSETDGAGVHHALDPVGGPHLMRSYKALRQGGRLYVFGGSAFVPGASLSRLRAMVQFLRTPRFAPMKMMGSNKAVLGVHIGRFKDRDLLKREMVMLLGMLNTKQIAPVVDRVFRFEHVVEAHRYIHARKNRGKVLLDFSPGN
jgi:NADPH:quinone reductase-like Zn-dependent oxidoreductase